MSSDSAAVGAGRAQRKKRAIVNKIKLENNSFIFDIFNITRLDGTKRFKFHLSLQFTTVVVRECFKIEVPNFQKCLNI